MKDVHEKGVSKGAKSDSKVKPIVMNAIMVRFAISPLHIWALCFIYLRFSKWCVYLWESGRTSAF